jgi:transcriptional regulator with XRE-family HTH domain
MLSPIRVNLLEKLKGRNYRHRFFKGRAEDELASKLIEFRKERGLTQAALARLCGMKQSAVSRIEKASYSRWSFATLWRVAKALDVRVQVILTDMADVIREYEFRYSDQRPSYGDIANQAAAAGAVQGMTSSAVFPELTNPVTILTNSYQVTNTPFFDAAVRGMQHQQAFARSTTASIPR